MNWADKLIVLGVITVPTAGAIFFGIITLLNRNEEGADWGLPLFFALTCLAIAVAAGLITTGVLLRKAQPK